MIQVCLMLLCFTISLRAQVYGRPAILKDVGIEQHMGAQVPLDVPFADEQGGAVTLRQFTGKPIVLALVYYQCPGLCDLVLNGIVRATRELKFTAGDEYQVVAVSFDARENYPLARDKKQTYVRDYGRAGAQQGWHFLTGADGSSRLLADTVGFHFTYDPVSNQFAHPSAIMILTPEGKVARYFYGIDYPVRDVKLGLIDASGGKIGSPIDAVQLFCFHYDPANGKYGLLIVRVLRLAGLATAGALALFILLMLRRDARSTRLEI
ncbi:MAG TPA: SCO family protein [Bryobacteraceae bacterium]|jgi:protein SCO1/2